MGAPVPCLGHPSRTAAIVALRSAGLNTRAIAEKIGIPENRVTSLEVSARRNVAGRTNSVPGRKPSAETGTLATLFPFHFLEQLRRHAARRDMSADRLIREIVERVVEDDIVDAVLDDRDDRS